MPGDRNGRLDPLESLSALLKTALELTGGLARDAHLSRLLRAFARLPPGDREALLAKLETEVEGRQRSVETGDGRIGPPNPLASLYVRVYENDRPLPEVTRDTLLRSTIQSTVIMARIPEVRRIEVEQALLTGMAMLEPADAEALARHHADLLALAACCEIEEPVAP
jgi:hypothetical protein